MKSSGLIITEGFLFDDCVWCTDVVDLKQKIESIWDEIKELESLGMSAKNKRLIINGEEIAALADVIKKSMYEDYKLAYSEKGEKHKEEAKSTIEP